MSLIRRQSLPCEVVAILTVIVALIDWPSWTDMWTPPSLKRATFIFTVILANVNQFLPRDAHSAKRGIAIVSSVCPSVPGAPARFQARVGKHLLNKIRRRKIFSFAHPGFQFAHPAIRSGCPPWYTGTDIECGKII